MVLLRLTTSQHIGTSLVNIGQGEKNYMLFNFHVSFIYHTVGIADPYHYVQKKKKEKSNSTSR